ncbi:cysteine--tRNA ligase [Pseudomonadota bacterium]
MKIYNTLTRKKEDFKPLTKGKVKMYVCGPTPYDFGHLGHGMEAVVFDTVRRYLLYKGYDVTYVFNYTDIDDKLIIRAEIAKTTVKELADRIIPEYHKDYEALGILKPDVEPMATAHIKEMVELVADLEGKGYAYVIDSDGVYFEVSKFKDYGKLSKQKLDELRSGSRVEVKDAKKDPRDFVLWKFAKPGEPQWDSPWGAGRPGWHIECSAMSRKYLGETFDIHGGGADLIFPHHECEIAQSEGSNSCDFARYWMHNAFIRIDNEKMSKSLGNFFTMRDIFKEFSPQAVRYLFIQGHYRSPIDFSDELLKKSEAGLARIHDFVRRLENYEGKSGNVSEIVERMIFKATNDIEAAMDDDFETPRALAAIFDLIKEINKMIDEQSLEQDDKENVMQFIQTMDKIFGIFTPTESEDIDSETEKMIEEKIKEREAAKSARDYDYADAIRDELLEKGIQLEDTPNGTTWKKV